MRCQCISWMSTPCIYFIQKDPPLNEPTAGNDVLAWENKAEVMSNKERRKKKQSISNMNWNPIYFSFNRHLNFQHRPRNRREQHEWRILFRSSLRIFIVYMNEWIMVPGHFNLFTCFVSPAERKGRLSWHGVGWNGMGWSLCLSVTTRTINKWKSCELCVCVCVYLFMC